MRHGPLDRRAELARILGVSQGLVSGPGNMACFGSSSRYATFRSQGDQRQAGRIENTRGEAVTWNCRTARRLLPPLEPTVDVCHVIQSRIALQKLPSSSRAPIQISPLRTILVRRRSVLIAPVVRKETSSRSSTTAESSFDDPIANTSRNSLATKATPKNS